MSEVIAEGAGTGVTGHTAAVLGAGMAGIWTARVLADHFERVLVVERDELPAAPEQRPGVPQGRQYHILLRRGLQIMERLFPDAGDALLAAGAVRFDQIDDIRTKFQGQWLSQYPSGEYLLACSRVLLETTVRERLQRHPRVEIIAGAKVRGLLAGERGQRITGVEIQHRRGPQRGQVATVEAGLIVDATGRSSGAPEWLLSLGYPAPEETVIDPHLGYVSRYYRQPQASYSWQMMLIFADPPDGTRGGLIFPQEGDTWVVMMAGTNRDYPPTDEAGFAAFARSVDPQFYEVLQTADPISPVYGYRRTANRWRHYERLSRWPEGFVVVGDAFCSFNPVYGQGMTVAAMTAVALGEQFERSGENLQGFAARFQKQVARVTKPAWLLSTSADLSYPETEGAEERKSVPDRLAYWYTGKVMETVPYNERVRRIFLDVNHLLRPATDLIKPAVLWPVIRHSL